MIKRLLHKILLFIILSLATISNFSCSERNAAKPRALDSLDWAIQPDQVAENFKIRFIDSNWTRAILYGGRGRVFSSRAETLIDKGLKLELYSKNSDKIITRLTADSARIDDNSHDMFAYGNVIVISDTSQTRLETTFLQWNNLQQKFYSNAFVRITSPSELIEGYGFESDQHLRNYKIYKVSGVKQ